MTRLQLEAASDLVQRLASDSRPEMAVIELIWNSLDADADHVEVILRRDEMGAGTFA